MSLVIADTWRPLGTGRQASAGALRDPGIADLVASYKRAVAGAYHSLSPEAVNSLPPGAYRVSTKIDGEQWCLHHDATGATLLSPAGRAITGIPLTEEAHACLGDWCGVLAGELYAQPAHGRPHVYDLHAALGGGQDAAVERLRFAAFDLPCDGDAMLLQHPVIERVARLTSLLPATGPMHHVGGQACGSGAEIAAYYHAHVTLGGAEGIVILHPDGRISKVKPQITLDAVVVGYTAQQGGVTDLLLSLLSEEGHHRLIGQVDLGFSDENRRQLAARLSTVPCDSALSLSNRHGRPYQWVCPTLVIEVQCHELLASRHDDTPIRRWNLTYQPDAGWHPLGKANGISLRDAVFLRIRDDKSATPHAVRWAQVTDLVSVPDIASHQVLPASTVLRREVYTRPLRTGGTAVRKVLVWQTNKADIDPRYPACVAQMTDFSPVREEPVHTELRTATDAVTIHRLVDEWLAQSIGRGWRCVARMGDISAPPPTPLTVPATETPTISISFARSTSPTFPVVRRRLDSLAALGTLTVTTNARGAESWFELTVGEVIPNFRRLQNLLALVRRWKSTEISVAGEVLDRDGADTLLNRLHEIHACWQRQRSRGPAECWRACRIGCHQVLLTPSQRYLQGALLHDPAWYTVGSFDGANVTLDKDAIVAQLDRPRNTPLTYCPYFAREAVTNAIRSLPDQLPAVSPEYRLLFHRDDGRPAWVWPQDVPLPPRLMARAQAQPGEESHRAVMLAPHQPPVRQTPLTRYTDVCGQQAAVEAVRELIELPLKYSHLFAAVGATAHPTGVILAGPPGTGKTLLARAIAGECGAHCEVIAGPEILSHWVGGSEQALRDIFTRAQQAAPSIIVFDEFDSIAPARALADAQHQQALVAQLLTLLDGIETRRGVYLVATTNRPEALDPAVRRPGRFDRIVWMRAPNLAGRIAILQHHLRPLRLAPALHDRDVFVRDMARRTRGASGADLAYLCQHAVRCCIREAVSAGQAPDEMRLTTEHFDLALMTLIRPTRRRTRQPIHPAP